MEIRAVRLAALLLCGVASLPVVTACGGSAPSYVTAAYRNDPQEDVRPAETSREALSFLRADEVPRFGAIVTDARGFTLYRFDRDPSSPPASTCAEECAREWPPVPADAPMLAHGIHQSLVGKIRRPDGVWQATLADQPLYRYSGDNVPGDVNGQGRDGDWFAITPSGTKARAAGPAAAARLGEAAPAASSKRTNTTQTTTHSAAVVAVHTGDAGPAGR
jgi:predicted lipoprotein with Yx(FWY)xxD motif